jgi:hypothetical protein
MTLPLGGETVVAASAATRRMLVYVFPALGEPPLIE